MKQRIQKQLDDNHFKSGKKYIPITNYFKCKWTKCSNQKASFGLIYKTTRPVSMLSTRDLPEIERHTQTESKEMKIDISCI